MLRKIIKRLSPVAGNSDTVVAIHLATASIRLVILQGAELKQSQTFSYKADNWQDSLQVALRSVPASCALHLVLSAERYQLVQLDKPALAEHELLQALPWQIKDLVTIAPEDMVLDYIDLPGSTQQPKINVVVCSYAWLKQLTAVVDAAGLSVSSIQPEEWLLSHIFPVSAQATMLVVHQPEQEMLIQIIRDGQLYFSRRTRGFSHLHLNSETELREGTLERLLLELQRSMDYFESQLKQPPVRDIRVLMAQTELICELFVQSGFSRVEPLNPAQSGAVVNRDDLLHNWPALAAASAGVRTSHIKQQVNLYQPRLYPVRDRLTLQRLIGSAAALTAVVVLGWLLLSQQQQQAGAALAEAELQLQRQLQQTDLYQQALAQRKPDEALVKQHQQAEYAVAQKQQLLSYLAEQQQQASQFYSPVLQHLQQVDLAELWLTNFTLQQASSSFSGVTLQPASITLWLEGLQQLGYFKGQRFSQVSMAQVPDTTAVSFVLMAQKGETL
ncbi:PilN domain-containing protein [Rheinheimera pacifica]|uniref:PilN domain-containing protein n=1 Tax=Rheinheimera pacifica TaxID=173990 RepID=UPI002EDB5B21